MICGYHGTTQEVCEWVINNVDPNTDNITVRGWYYASLEHLKSFTPGPDIGFDRALSIAADNSAM